MSALWIVLLLSVAALASLKLFTNLKPIGFGAAVVVLVITTGTVAVFDALTTETRDYELWNGEISAKENVVRNCPRGWRTSKDSFCSEYRTREVYDGETCSGSGKKRTCTSNYHTEYKYHFPWEGRWYLFAENLNRKTWEIRRVDLQGAIEPGPYTYTKIGDPASITNMYSSWVRGSADSLFHEDGEAMERYKDMIPEYPIRIYDYVKVDRIVPVGVALPDNEKFNRKLSEALKQLGPKRQMNAVIVVVDANKAPSADYAYAVRRAWKGFKKNDAVIFIGVKDGNLAWAEVLSWSKASLFNIELREQLLVDRNKPLDLNNVISYIETIGLQSYERRSMKEFEYLKDELQTPLWAIITAFILNALVILATFFISRKENKYVYR